MKSGTITLFMLTTSVNSFAQCDFADKSLTEVVFKNDKVVFSCTILDSRMIDRGQIYSTAKINEVFIGNVKDTVFKFYDGNGQFSKAHVLKVGAKILYYGYSGRYIYLTDCNSLSKEINDSNSSGAELKLIKEFADIFNKKKSGKFKFYWQDSILVAKGRYKRGDPVGVWYHYYNNGKLKSQDSIKKCSDLKLFVFKNYKLSEDGKYHEATPAFQRDIQDGYKKCLVGFAQKEIQKLFGNPTRNLNYVFEYLLCPPPLPPNNAELDLEVYFNKDSVCTGVSVLGKDLEIITDYVTWLTGDCITQFKIDSKNYWRRDSINHEFFTNQLFIKNLDSIYSKCLINQDTTLLFDAIGRATVISYVPKQNQNKEIVSKTTYDSIIEDYHPGYNSTAHYRLFIYLNKQGKIEEIAKETYIINIQE